MPQAWKIFRPYFFSNASISACGTAEPPTYIARIAERSNAPGLASRYCSTPIQIVGTPPVRVTRSRTNRSTRLAGSRCGPGITNLAPTMIAPNGMPHALAWNIGTTGIIVSRSQMAMQSTCERPRVCSTSARCEYITPFGLPVVPVV